MVLRLSSRFAAAIPGVRAKASRGALLRVGLVAAALGVSAACSTNNVLDLRPDVDVGSQTAAVANSGMRALVPNDPYLQQAEARQQPPELEEQTYPGQQTYVGQTLESEQPVYSEQPAATEPQSPTAVAGEPPYLQAPAAAGQQVAMVAPAGSGLPLIVAEPAEDEPPASQPIEPQQPVAPQLAAYPRMNAPAAPAPMPADELAFRRELKKLGVTFRELAPIRDSASCYINHPVKVSGLPGGVQLKPAATLSAEMALTFARWTKEELNPAARLRYWSRVKTIHQMSSYSCRRINGSRSMSQHSKGNAIDIGRIELANGKDIDVEKPGLFAFRTRGFLNNVRADGCSYFSTVLGPGYNYDHRNHFHFDIMPRRNGRVACH